MNTLFTAIMLVECALSGQTLTAQILAEPQIEDVLIYEGETEVLVALLYKPTFFKSQADSVEKRVNLLASAYYGKSVVVSRDSGSYYKLKNCINNPQKAENLIKSVKNRKH